MSQYLIIICHTPSNMDTPKYVIQQAKDIQQARETADTFGGLPSIAKMGITSIEIVELIESRIYDKQRLIRVNQMKAHST